MRPQHIQLSDEGIPAIVERSVYQGERYLLDLKLSDGQIVAAYHPSPVAIQSVVKLRLKQGWVLENE